ncbi:MAG: metal ABC transporter ATP-binding protein [Clostridiales bacterium]|nr:metal ABC transporter ATP-binding protein [Clostridiales bacterium]
MPVENGCGLCKVKIEDMGVVKGRDVLLENVNFEMHCGQLTAIIGTNGAGKTTLLRSILGEIRHEGTVAYESHDGKVIKNITIGYVPQHLEFDRFSPVSVMDFLLAGQSTRPVWLKPDKKIKERMLLALESVGCSGLENRMLGDLSGGEIQRVMLAQAINPIPELLILDEPVSGVDMVGAEQFYQQVSQLRKDYHMAIVMVSHDLNLVREYADTVLLINKTVLKQGDVNEVYNSAEFRNTFGGGI